jgi:HEAT repeat protein/predicted protein tyrosine phosphatase
MIAAYKFLELLPSLSNDQLKDYLLATDMGVLVQVLSQVKEASQALRIVELSLERNIKWGAQFAGAVMPALQPQTVALVSQLNVSLRFKHQLLGLTGSDFAIPLLLESLYDGDDWAMRSAVQALVKIGSKLVVVELTRSLAYAQSEKVRAWAAWGLSQINNNSALTGLTIALNHSLSEVRIWSVWALGEMKTSKAIAILVKALNHEDSQVRWRAAQALGKKRNQMIVPYLLKALQDHNDIVRGRAASALGLIGDPAAVPGLLTILELHDPDSFLVGLRASEALGKIGGTKATRGLINALEHPDCDVRGSVVSALGNIGTKDAIEALVGALQDRDTIVRGRISESLGQLNGENAIAGLVQALNDPEYYVRWQAVAGLGNIGNDKVVPRLMECLNDDISSVRQRAIKSLEEIGSEAALNGLRQALNHPLEDVRRLAGKELQKMRRDVVDFDSIFPNSSQSYHLPKLLITSEAEASEYLLDPITGFFIESLISIGSPGIMPPQGFMKIPNRLRLEFDDIETPISDPDYCLPCFDDIIKVINFVAKMPRSDGRILIHCHAGISRSTAIALTVCATILGAGKEEEAIVAVLMSRPQAKPNRWIVELADMALERDGKLIETIKKANLYWGH